MSELKSYSVVASSEAHNYINGEINLAFEAYDADEVDALLAKKDAEIAELKQKLDDVNELIKTARKMLEDAKATAYAESVDAGMRERRLKRALYKACANWADVEVFERTVGIDDPNVEANRWALMRNKCLKKAEEFGG